MGGAVLRLLACGGVLPAGAQRQMLAALRSSCVGGNRLDARHLSGEVAEKNYTRGGGRSGAEERLGCGCVEFAGVGDP